MCYWHPVHCLTLFLSSETLVLVDDEDHVMGVCAGQLDVKTSSGAEDLDSEQNPPRRLSAG